MSLINESLDQFKGQCSGHLFTPGLSQKTAVLISMDIFMTTVDSLDDDMSLNFQKFWKEDS